jgi:hypothetical protein
MRYSTVFGALAAIAVTASSSASQNAPPTAGRPADPTIGPPVRKIATASAVSAENLGGIVSVVELPDGRVLVNDGTRRRLLVMDTTLTKVEVLLDSLSEIANMYGQRAGQLVPYRADSTLFIDPASYAIVVIDPAGKITRVRSVWRVNDAYYYSTPTQYGFPGTDAKGRIVYRMYAQAAPPKVAPPPGVPYIPVDPDSNFIVAADIDTRKIDTIGVIRIPKQDYIIKMTPEGYISIFQKLNPLPSTDDWAVLPNGDVAFVRGRDYRVEYLHPDGTMSSGPKIPFDWQRLMDEDKQRLVDSVKKANERQVMTSYVQQMVRWVNQYKKDYPASFKVPADFTPPNGWFRDWKLPPDMKLPPTYVYACAVGEEAKMIPPANSAAGAAPPQAMPGPPGAPGPLVGTPSCIPTPIMLSGGNAPPPPTMREIGVLQANELPDYRPPIGPNSVRADLDNNLWIRTIPPKPVPGGPIFDVVNPKGELTDRIQVPPGYALVGFGRGKVVYLSMRDAKGIHLARVRLR